MIETFLEEMSRRGLIHDQTPEIPQKTGPEPSAYVGFDPTADSLHIGSLSTLMSLVHFQRCGGRPIVLVGGATAMIGDPSGKSAERNLLDLDAVRHNAEAMKAQLARFLELEGPRAAVFVNNHDWIGGVSLLHFLRDVGKHLTVNYMMAKDSVQKRLETGISFTEFSYQLLQAYDYYHLYTTHNCRLQMGGSDQWGNITAGIELIRRMAQGEASGFTCPLLTKSDGSKFGKTEQGNVWLDAHRTSPYKFHQFLLNASDEEAPRLLKVFSLRPLEEIDATLAEHEAKPGARIGQRAIADELTERVHGADALERAHEAAAVLFGAAPIEALNRLSPEELEDVFEGVPAADLPRSELADGMPALDLLAAAGAAPSKSEARRLVKGGGVRVNKLKVDDEQRRFTAEDLLQDRYLLVQVGKKNYYLARFQN